VTPLGQARHDGAHQLAVRGAEIEAEARLGQDANFPAVQVVECLDEVLRAPAPAAELGDEDGVDLAGFGPRQDFGALGPCGCPWSTLVAYAGTMISGGCWSLGVDSARRSIP